MKTRIALIFSIIVALASLTFVACQSIPGQTGAPPALYFTNVVVGGVTNSSVYVFGMGPLAESVVDQDIQTYVALGVTELLKVLPKAKPELQLISQTLNDVMLQGNYNASTITNAITSLGIKGVSQSTISGVLSLANIWLLPTIDAKLGPSTWTAGVLKSFTAALNTSVPTSSLRGPSSQFVQCTLTPSGFVYTSR